MARLPAPEDIQRARMPANTPGVSLKTPDYGPVASAGKAMADGLNKLGAGFEAVVAMNDQVDDYETKKKILDFQFNAEMKQEEYKRSMPVGAQGYADSWQNDFKGMAADFVGKNDANIPASQRAKVGLALKRIETQLHERAQRDQFAEQDRFELDGLNETSNKLRGTVEADPARLEEMRNEGRSLIELSRLTPAAKHKALQTYEKELEKTYFISKMGKVKTKEDLDALKQDLGPDLPDKFQGPGKPGKAAGWAESNADYSNASGKEISKGIYQAFRKLGYTDFGAQTMLAEIHREHGAEFSKEHGSRRPFGFEVEPANAAQINFGFINSTGKRTEELISALEKEGLVSYDAPKSRLNPKGIRVENSQKALDVMAAWYDQDLATNGARDKNAIIRGADPRELPKLLRDENYNDVHDAHRRTAAWIQWQHPEIYGGKYRNGIAGQRHYDAMLANRSGFHRLLSDVNGPVEGGDPNAPGYEGPGRRLSITERRTLWNQAQTDWAKHVAGMGKEIDQFEALAGTGATLPDAHLGDLQKRVEASGDDQLKTRFAATLGYANFMINYEKMPLQERLAYADQNRARLGDKMTPAQQKFQEKLDTSNAQTRQKLADDPLTYTMRSGAPLPIMARNEKGEPIRSTAVAAEGPDGFSEPVMVKQLNFNSPSIDADLSRRMDQARIVSEYHRVPFKAFTADERLALQGYLQKGGDSMLRVLGKVATAAANAGEDPAVALREVTKDAPEVAMVGTLVAQNADRNLLDTAAKAISYKASLKENFKSYVDRTQVKADEGEYAKVVKNMRGDVDAIRSLADLIYTYEAPRKGFGPDSFNKTLYQDVVGRILGKVTTPDGLNYGGVGKQNTGGWFSSPVLVPPGVRTDRFDEMKSAFRTSDFAYVGRPLDASGKPYSAAEIRQMEWDAVGPGQYILVEQNMPDGKRKIAGTGRNLPDGRPEPFVLDVRQMMAPLQRRMPEILLGYDGRATGIDDDPQRAKSRWPGGSFDEIEVPSHLR